MEDKLVTKDVFYALLNLYPILLHNILADEMLVIPDWPAFKNETIGIFNKIRSQPATGKVATYIPQLAKVNPDQMALSFCSVDGQRFVVGDSDQLFCCQSVSKTVSYLIALQEHGERLVHRFISHEPSGRNFNDLCLNSENIPHNPLINSGGIMSNSLIQTEAEQSARFEYILDFYKRLAGGKGVNRIGFSNSVFLSERATADRNFCIAYMMQEKKSFQYGRDTSSPPRQWNQHDLLRSLELYFMCCSIEMDVESGAILAATLALGGVCPVTGDQIFSPQHVKSCLSLMFSCGMYDFSGEWGFTIGIPAKSGVSGVIIAVVVGVGGFCFWSPRLDKNGNSSAGVEFFLQLTKHFSFHQFDKIPGMTGNDGKRDPCIKKRQMTESMAIKMNYAAAKGDVQGVYTLVAQGANVQEGDYDGRTPLHLAAAEGNLRTVKVLLTLGADPTCTDRWGGTALMDAIRENRTSVCFFCFCYMGCVYDLYYRLLALFLHWC